MLVENYPFSIAGSADVARPYLPITLVNPENERELNVFALIDPGADECALLASFASPLGHNLQAGYQKKVSMGNGITVAYGHTICIKAFDFTSKGVVIDFMPNLNMPLLGVKSFLSGFTLEVDYPNKVFSIM